MHKHKNKRCPDLTASWKALLGRSVYLWAAESIAMDRIRSTATVWAGCTGIFIFLKVDLELKGGGSNR
jgi:hypothetical protein